MRLHLDTDFGGDADDACALAMLLGWPGVEIVGITTNLDMGGERAGCVEAFLALAGRSDIPCAAGAAASMTTLNCYGSSSGDVRYWPDLVPARPSSAGKALDLLQQSIDRGATIIAIGASTNLAQLAILRPGILDGVAVVLMGGWLHPPAAGLPQWGPEMDWNVQSDTRAAEVVLATKAQLTLATLPVTMQAQLRSAQLPRLRSAGPLGALLARQAQVHAAEDEMSAMARKHAGLPNDLLNFHYDPVACAVAVGWQGITVKEARIQALLDGEVLRFREVQEGRLTSVLTDLDADAFNETWLSSVEAADSRR